PLRRYPRCYARYGGGYLPSLPFLAAAVARKDGPFTRQDYDELCKDQRASAEPAPIEDTLPSFGLRRIPGDRVPDDPHDFALRALYGQIYTRCLASSFWPDPKAGPRPCDDATAYENKVVVIGASSSIRRDLHYTPFGTMTGAEVVLNAIRT